MIQEIHKGLLRQLGLVGQFDRHYRRKEELMFPIMEKYGHDSPPKVMWGWMTRFGNSLRKFQMRQKYRILVFLKSRTL